MASPQRNFPLSERQPAPELLLEPQRSAPGRRTLVKRRVIQGLLAGTILGIWYVGWGWGNSGGWLWGDREMPASSNGQLSGSGVAILTVANKEAYIGQSFQVQNVPVDRRVGNAVLWIGQWHDSLPMLLVLASDSGAKTTETQPGDVLDVIGTIVRAPARAVAKQQWGLGDEDLDQLAQEGAYVQATQVRAVRR
jgi:hypothetical protein